MKRIFVILLSTLLLASCGGGDSNVIQPNTGPKVIIDSDYNTMSDDGQLGVMAVQLQAQGKINVLGITVVSGNQWLKQCVADALKSVERLGVGDKIGVYSGENHALSHDFATIQKESALFPGGDGYLGACSSPEPMSQSDLHAPPDGCATTTKLQSMNAVDFIIQSVKKYPHQVTILAIGPMTNVALAVRKNPEIVPLIKQIIYMGGAIDVKGNTTPTAEFNWWFDPEAAQTTVRLPIPQVVIPLDVTDTVVLDKKNYDRVANDPTKQTIITQIFKKLVGYGFSGTNGFENNPNYTQDIWDTLTLMYLMDPSYATETVDMWVDVDMSFGANAGRSIGYRNAPPAGVPLQKMTVVKRFDNARFFNAYTDLLTRPVPVKLP